jgi:branched-chain amino acid transport system permease protein
MDFQLIINIVVSSMLYLIVANSFVLIYNVSKFFHIAHASIITFSAYFTFLFFHQLNCFFGFSVFIAIILSILIGLSIELWIYRRLVNKKTSSLIILITSLGLYIIFQNLISIFWGDGIKIIRNRDILVGNKIFGAYITDVQLTSIMISFFLFLLINIFLKYHRIGIKIRAVSANSELASIHGINTDRITLWTFGIGSGIAAIAGILVASDTGMTPTMGFNLLLYGVVAIIIGGVGSTWGLIGGVFLLGAAQHLTAYYIDSKWLDAITYLILILFLIWKPLGFSGTRLKKIEI